MSAPPIRGFSRLHRLSRERIQREIEQGQHEDVQEPEPTPVVATIAPPTRAEGVSQHPQWFQVRALIRRQDGSIEPVFLAEYPKAHHAIVAASTYQFRAIVINKHSKQEFDNRKPIEPEPR